MPEPLVDLIDPRGTAARGTTNRITTPDPPQDYPPFSLEIMVLMSQAAIPDALAYALKWQLELDRQQTGYPQPTEAQQELAAKLLAVFDFLLGQQLQVQRDPRDGALLYLDPLQQYARAPARHPRLVEISTGEAIPVTDDVPDLPLPPWAPSVFPRELSAKSRARYPSRPRTLAQIPPFSSPLTVASWLRLRAWRPPPPPGSPAAQRLPTLQAPPGTRLAAEPRPAKPVDAKALDAALDQAAARYESNRAAAEANQPYTSTPLVANAIRQLSSYTLADLRTATGAKVKSPWEDDKLIEHTDIILYHSVFTVVLDHQGNPFDLRANKDRPGLLPYALLVPEPGSQMRRALPDPGGVTVSVQHYGDTSFRIEKGEIHKVLFGGVASFVEYGYGYTGEHDLQKTIERFLQPGVYIASVTAEAAFTPADADISRIYQRLGDLADAAEPYVVDEITTRLKKMVENWEEIAGQVLREAIKQIILDEIRAQITKYLIKKIGKKIVPVINALSTAYDLLTRDFTRERYAIACAFLAVKGTTEEDIELAAKVVSKICADEFEDKVIQKLIEAAHKAGKQIVMRTRKPPSLPKPPPDTKAADPAEHARPAADPPADTKPPTRQSVAPPARESAAEAEARLQVNQYAKELQKQMADAMKSSTATPPSETVNTPQKPSAAIDSTNSGTDHTGAKAANRSTDDTGVPATTTSTSGGTPPVGRTRRPSRPEVYGPYRQDQEHLMPPRRRRRQPPSGPAATPAPDERGTLDKPRKLDPGPAPPPAAIHVGDSGESAPEEGMNVRGQANVRTSSASAERLLRSEDEKVRGAFPIDHDAHHAAEKKGGAAQGDAIRDSLSVAGVSVNDAANAARARGLPRDPRAPLESSSQHWGEHIDEKRKPLRKELQTVQEDDDAARGVLEKHSRAVYEDRPVVEPEFYLGPDPDEPGEE